MNKMGGRRGATGRQSGGEPICVPHHTRGLEEKARPAGLLQTGRIALVVSSLEAGGAERVMATLANEWASKAEVFVITIGDANADFYELDKRIKRYDLKLTRPSRNAIEGAFANLKRVRQLRARLSALRPSVIISFGTTTNILTLLAAGATHEVMVSERTDPRHHHIGGLWSLLRKLTYPQAGRVVVQTEGVAQWVRHHIPRARVAVIPNPLPRDLLIQPVPPLPRGPERRLVAMGRLSEEKQFGLLIQVFSRLAQGFPDWSLWIWGEGPLRQALEEQVKALGLQGRVLLPGRTRQPWCELAKADVFVLPSRYEGFPNVMLEAMALGRPCVAFDCDSGPRELSEDDVAARLVEAGNNEELSTVLRRYMSNDESRRQLAALAVSVRTRFNPDVIRLRWEEGMGTDAVGVFRETGARKR